MPQLNDLTQLLIAFRDARNWKQFHNPKDLALALSIEASELLEAFLWKSPEEVPEEKIREEVLVIKNTYRTLMTRGMKGCLVFSSDAETRQWLSQTPLPQRLTTHLTSR